MQKRKGGNCMQKYYLYWKAQLIGELWVDGNKHKYEPMLTDEVMCLPLEPEVLEKREWGPEIPFFQTRIDAAKKFPNMEIGFLTDFYTLKRT